MGEIEIRSPRYRDRVVLIAKWKVMAENIIRFTEAKSYMNNEYLMSGTDIRKYPVEMIKSKTGKENPFYAVPLDVVLNNVYVRT